jgi:hypothetical protein
MMPPDPRQIEEWLSGMLDGALSEEEQQQLDIAMQNDPSIAERLEELAILRRSLLSGRSVGRLGTAFPNRVVQAARERASQMDAPPAWILPDAPNAVAPQGQEPLWSEGYSEIDRPVAQSVDIPHGASVRGQKAMVRGIMGPGQEHVSVSVRERLVRVWLPSIAVVAALCALFVALPRSGPVNPNSTPDVAETPTENPTNNPGDGFPNGAPNSAIVGDVNDPARDSKPNTSTTEPILPNNGSNGSIATVPESNPAMQPKILPAGQVPQNGSVFVLVANISVDPVAQQNDMLSDLLNKYEIISTADATLERTDVEKLVASQILKPIAVDPNLKGDDLTVYVVKASFERIDSFLVDVQQQFKDFPSYKLSMTADPAVSELLNQLASVSDSAQQAKRVVFKDPQTGESSPTIDQPKDDTPKDDTPKDDTPKDDTPKEATKEQLEIRKNAKRPIANGKAPGNPQEGFLLLLVRPAK